MCTDRFIPALLRDADIFLAVAITTQSCRKAQRAHQLAQTSTVALGRLLTAAALTGLKQRTTGITSLQILCKGRLQQLLAEVTQDGQLRGLVRNKTLALPEIEDGKSRLRRSVNLGIGEGILSVIREPEGQHYSQSTTPILTGEIDVDVQQHLNDSDQIPSALVCDVVVDDSNQIQVAGGLIAQLLPVGDIKRLAGLREFIADGGFVGLLNQYAKKPEHIFEAIAPGAEFISGELELRWQCRCSRQRVINALALLGRSELAEMIQEREPAEVTCDYCSKVYSVDTDELLHLFDHAAKAEG